MCTQKSHNSISVYLSSFKQERFINRYQFNMAIKIQDGRHQVMFSDSSKNNIYNLDILVGHRNNFIHAFYLDRPFNNDGFLCTPRLTL